MTAPPAPTFHVAHSCTGRLTVTWPPQPTGQADLIIALRPVGPELADAFWAGGLDNDLIRVPIALGRGNVLAHVPAGRDIWLAIVRRDNGPPLTIEAREADEVAPQESRLEAPTRHHASADRHTPLIFIDNAGADLESLAGRVAMHAGRAPVPVSKQAGSTVLAAMQGPYLTRLKWAPIRAGGARLLIFDGIVDVAQGLGDDLTSRADVHPVPEACDGVVDAVTPTGVCANYVLLDGIDGWRPLHVERVRPPYEMGRTPLLLGAVADRLDAMLEQLAVANSDTATALRDLELQAEIVEGASHCLPQDSDTRRRADAFARDLRTHRRFGP